jgi:hypothetical protein
MILFNDSITVVGLAHDLQKTKLVFFDSALPPFEHHNAVV